MIRGHIWAIFPFFWIFKYCFHKTSEHLKERERKMYICVAFTCHLSIILSQILRFVYNPFTNGEIFIYANAIIMFICGYIIFYLFTKTYSVVREALEKEKTVFFVFRLFGLIIALYGVFGLYYNIWFSSDFHYRTWDIFATVITFTVMPLFCLFKFCQRKFAKHNS